MLSMSYEGLWRLCALGTNGSEFLCFFAADTEEDCDEALETVDECRLETDRRNGSDKKSRGGTNGWTGWGWGWG